MPPPSPACSRSPHWLAWMACAPRTFSSRCWGNASRRRRRLAAAHTSSPQPVPFHVCLTTFACLQDKRGRLYIVTAAADTKVDLKGARVHSVCHERLRCRRSLGALLPSLGRRPGARLLPVTWFSSHPPPTLQCCRRGWVPAGAASAWRLMSSSPKSCRQAGLSGNCNASPAAALHAQLHAEEVSCRRTSCVFAFELLCGMLLLSRMLLLSSALASRTMKWPDNAAPRVALPTPPSPALSFPRCRSAA